MPKVESTTKTYPKCPQCGQNTIVGFARPNEPFKNDSFDYDQKSAELYCCNGTTNCNYRISFSDLTTPINLTEEDLLDQQIDEALKDEDAVTISKETARRNIAEWLYVNDGRHHDKFEWREKLLEVIGWNIKRIE